jgi:hypothetical protein
MKNRRPLWAAGSHALGVEALILVRNSVSSLRQVKLAARRQNLLGARQRFETPLPADRLRNPQQQHDRYVTPACLDLRDVALRYAGLARELPARHVPERPHRTQAIAQLHEKLALVGGQKRPASRDGLSRPVRRSFAKKSLFPLFQVQALRSV